MKQVLFIIACLLMTSAVSAQKVVRDSIRLGNKAFEEQRYHEAEINFKSALNRDPKSKEASFNLANTYYKQSRWDDALKEYQHYLTIENENQTEMGSAWHNIGNTLLKKKELKQSIDAYKNALRLNPADEDSRYNLAVAQKILKDQEDESEGGGQDKDQQQQQDQKQDQKDQKQDQQQDQQQDKKEKKPEEQEQQQVSRESANQILQAIEQDEKETQEKVKQMKAAEKQKQNEDNKRQNKDW